MAIEEVPPTSPNVWYMIMQFDPRTAELIKFGDTYAASEYNLAEARRDAQEYAEQAATNNLPLQFMVVKVEVDKAYRPLGG